MTFPIHDLIYGTAFRAEGTPELVEKAVLAGFRAFDTAGVRTTYREDLLAATLRKLYSQEIITREDIYVLKLCHACCPAGHLTDVRHRFKRRFLRIKRVEIQLHILTTSLQQSKNKSSSL